MVFLFDMSFVEWIFFDQIYLSRIKVDDPLLREKVGKWSATEPHASGSNTLYFSIPVIEKLEKLEISPSSPSFFARDSSGSIPFTPGLFIDATPL